MTDDLLKLVNRKNDLYRDWKSTSDNVEYERKKVNFKTYDRIVNQNIRDAKNLYYFNTFTERKNDMKQTWGIINETLNKGKQRSDFPSAFKLGSRTITDSREIANEFNTFFCKCWGHLFYKTLILIQTIMNITIIMCSLVVSVTGLSRCRSEIESRLGLGTFNE